MLSFPMKPPGSFKLTGRAKRHASEPDDAMDPGVLCDDRCDRIVDSLRMQILEADVDQHLRIRQIFENPREIFRVEIDRPGQGYLRTTLLDRDALEELLATDDVRARVTDSIDSF